MDNIKVDTEVMEVMEQGQICVINDVVIPFLALLHFFAFIWCFFAWVIEFIPFYEPENDPHSTIYCWIGSSFSDSINSS